jgi:hypothetical protein
MATTATPKPSPEKIFATLTAYQQTFALKAAIDLDLFTAIGKGLNDSASLAKELNASERGVRILADNLAIQGFLRKENGQYSLAQDSAVFLDKRSPAYMGAMAHFLTAEDNLRNFSDLAGAVRKGGTTSSIGDNHKPVDDRWVNFARSMGSMAAPMAGVLAQIVSTSSSNPIRVLDIAAGHGMYGVIVAKSNPRVHVTDRHSVRPGSAFDTDLGEGYDYVLITNFLHHFDTATNETLLRRFHAALKPGGKAITVEFVPNEDRVTPTMSAGFSLVMLANTDVGDAYTFSEYEKMFRSAGFKNCVLQPVPELPQQLVIAEK